MILDTWGLESGKTWEDWEEYQPMLSTARKAKCVVVGSKPFPNLKLKITMWNIRGASKQ